MRIAIAHESSGIVAALRQVVSSLKGWRVAWVAGDAGAVRDRCAVERPDILLLSPVLPGADGAAVTRSVMKEAPCVVVMVTRDPRLHAGAVFDAMSAGAVDAVAAPTVGPDGQLLGLDDVARRLKAAGRLVTQSTPAAQTVVAKGAASGPPLVAIGASTGGPAAVAAVLSSLPVSLDAGVVVVQHVDAKFAQNLVEWLGGATRLPVRLAKVGDRPLPGTVAVTASNDDLVLTPGLDFAYRRPRNGTFYHPSVDVFFESAAAHWPAPGVAVLLTGIGRDGAAGLLALRQKGWLTIAQDERSSVVYGMPRAAAELNAAVQVLPVDRIGAAIVHALAQRGTDKRGTRG
jgi:two-component system response regulator WspF